MIAASDHAHRIVVVGLARSYHAHLLLLTEPFVRYTEVRWLSEFVTLHRIYCVRMYECVSFMLVRVLNMKM